MIIRTGDDGSGLVALKAALLGFPIAVCLLGVGCSSSEALPSPVSENEIEPWGVEIPQHPVPGFEIQTPIYRVPAGSEQMFCLFGTFEEDLAIQTYEWFHHPTFGHHMVVRAVRPETAEEYPDGSVVDCLWDEYGEEVDLGPSSLLFNGTEAGLVRGRMNLLEDQAVLLQGGTRYMIQSHFINVTTRDVYLRDILHFRTIPLEQVQRPVGTWTLTSDDFLLPANSALDVTDECYFSEDLYLSMLMVHMHFSGTHFSSDLIASDLQESNFLDVPIWPDEWQYYFPNLQYEPGMPIPAESSLRYTCHFQNDLDRDLSWPDEMCVFEGLAYPLLRPYVCDNGVDDSGLVLDEFVFPDEK